LAVRPKQQRAYRPADLDAALRWEEPTNGKIAEQENP
jgi:hypothetical protein